MHLSNDSPKLVYDCLALFSHLLISNISLLIPVKQPHLLTCLHNVFTAQTLTEKSSCYLKKSRLNVHLPSADADVGDDECFNGHGSPPSAPSYGWVGDLRLDLPVDEDDYLMPSPQPSGLATVGPSHQHYMDLMADNPGENFVIFYF